MSQHRPVTHQRHLADCLIDDFIGHVRLKFHQQAVRAGQRHRLSRSYRIKYPVIVNKLLPRIDLHIRKQPVRLRLHLLRQFQNSVRVYIMLSSVVMRGRYHPADSLSVCLFQ